MASRFVRKVRTASGAVAVEVVVKDGGQVVEVDHVGSAHTDGELALLFEAARERLQPGQGVLDLGPLPQARVSTEDVADWTRPAPLPGASAGGRPEMVAAGGRVIATSAEILWRVLARTYDALGFDALGDETFKALVLARIIEPTSKADALRVLAEVGAPAPALRTVFRSLARCVERDYRDTRARACTARGRLAGHGLALEVAHQDGAHRVGDAGQAAGEGPALLPRLGQGGQDPHVEQHRLRRRCAGAVVPPGDPSTSNPG